MSLRRTPALLASALLSLSLVACGGDEEPRSAEPSATETASESQAGTPTPSESTTAEGGETPSATGDPEVQQFLDRLKTGFGDEGSVHVSMRMTGPQRIQAEGDTAYGPDGSDLRMTMLMDGMGEQEMTMIVVDERVFVSMPGLTPAGKFFQIPEDSPLLAQFDSAGMSPADSFAGFEAGLERVERVGTEQVGGQQTEHVRLHVDADRAMGAMDMGAVPGLPETIVYDVWLDDQDRMRRLRYELGGTRIVMDMTQWGSEVRIEPPPARELVEAPQM